MVAAAVSAEVGEQDLDLAVRHLRAGQLVAFPTETVYGLGADALNVEAVARIYRAKGRPANHPVIVHLARNADAAAWGDVGTPLAQRLIERFWPGPLTLIVSRSDQIPDIVSGGQNSIGLRCPAHPLAQALLHTFSHGATHSGLAAPSANRFGRVSPTTAQHVREEFGESVMVLDGGPCQVGIESTILDLTRIQTLGPVILRPGVISGLELAEEIGALPGRPDGGGPRASGTLKAHYAPSTPLRLVGQASLEAVPDGVAVWAFSAGQDRRIQRWWHAPSDPVAYAHLLYAILRELDASGAREIWIEQPPDTDSWAGINDRLARAAAGSGREQRA